MAEGAHDLGPGGPALHRALLAALALAALLLALRYAQCSAERASAVCPGEAHCSSAPSGAVCELARTGKAIMLSIPTTVRMARSAAKRTFGVAARNAAPEDGCFCFRLGFAAFRPRGGNGTLPAEASPEGWFTYEPGKLLRGAATSRVEPFPIGCGEPCSGDLWRREVRKDGIDYITVGIEVPRDPAASPLGRYAFDVDVCEYRPPCAGDAEGCRPQESECGRCEPERCTSSPSQACRASEDRGCYAWQASERFYVEVAE